MTQPQDDRQLIERLSSAPAGSEGHLERVAEKTHQGGDCPEGSRNLLHQRGRLRQRRAAALHRIEALALEVFDERMFRVEAARWARQPLALYASEFVCERLAADCLAPGCGFFCNGGAHLAQRPGFRVPQTAAEKHLARREVHVEARCVHVLAQRMAEMTGGMLLVRTLVMGKTHVAVNAEHRAAVRPRIGGELF